MAAFSMQKCINIDAINAKNPLHLGRFGIIYLCKNITKGGEK